MEEFPTQQQQQLVNPTPSAGRGSRGKFNLNKCESCRKDKKKCEPQSRQWPQRCFRCEEMGFRCSPSTRARKQRKAEKRAPLHPVQANSPPSSMELSPSLDSSPSGPFDQWTHADLSNAISFLKIFHRLGTKFRRWKRELNGIRHWHNVGGLDDIETKFDSIIETLSEKLLEYVTFRITILSTEENDAAATEVSNLHVLACSIIEASHAKWSPRNDNTCLTAAESTVIDALIKSMSFNHEVGAALLLEDEFLAERGHVSNCQDTVHCVSVLSTRFETFRQTMNKVWNVLHNSVNGYDEIIFHCERASVIDSNARWVRSLVKAKAFWGLRDCLGSTVLHGILEGLGRGRFVLSKEEEEYFYGNIGPHCANHNTKDISGRSAIHIAVQYNVPKAVAALLESGINPDDREGRFKVDWFPLHYAAALGHMEVCVTLLHYTKRVSSVDAYMETPLDYALRKGNRDIVRLLLETGAAATDLERDERLVFWKALQSSESPGIWTEILDWYEMVHFPMTLGSLQDRYGDTLFHIAVQNRKVEAIQELAERSAKGDWRSINLQDKMGQTVLCRAVSLGPGKDWVAMIEVLLSIDGIDVHIPDRHGKTPLDYAKRYENAEILRMLQDKQQPSTRSETSTSEQGQQSVSSLSESLHLPMPSRQLHQSPPHSGTAPGYFSHTSPYSSSFFEDGLYQG
ncbi:putative ankyrin repeat protein [Cercophora samala]|uniref:Ankyrin repeat protein n=1 Tax=Cercophora samala TaxID=330535 RepID=A0AA39Z3V7_9PEZI|nr:putative ankyrin repeat protein [Cercophora samala]